MSARVKNTSLSFLIVLIEIFNAYAQSALQYNGIYKTGNNGEMTIIAPWGTQRALFFSDGTVFGLKVASDGFTIGKTVGNTDESTGQISFTTTNEKTTINIKYHDGSELVGEKVKLLEKRIEFNNGKQKLVGELILPLGNVPFPIVVQTHGSGEETREASRGMAYLFAANGIASFIFDKRGCGESSGKEWRAAFEEYAHDLLAAVEAVSKMPEIDIRKIGLFGHSQGGWVVPLAYSLKPDKFSFCILSAANAVTPVEENLYAGDEEIRLLGYDEMTIKEIHHFRKIKYDVGISGKGLKEYKNSILPEAEKKPWFKLTGGNLPDNIFWKKNGYYDAQSALNSITCPVLLLYAEHDISTDSKTNLPLMQKWIPSDQVTFKLFEKANHAMMKVEKKDFSSKQMPFIRQFADGYIETIVGWLNKIL